MKNQFAKIAQNLVGQGKDKYLAYQIKNQYKNNPPGKEKTKEIVAIRQEYERNRTLMGAEYGLELQNLAEKYRVIESGFIRQTMEKELEVLKRPILKEINIVNK